MKKIVAIVVTVSFALSSCNYNSPKNAPPEIGITDSTSIAQDTSTQMAIESSYEYHKTLTESEKLVYDIIAYGGSASIGQYAIIRRGADNKPDTIAHGDREGIIVNTFMADLNNNGNSEIYIILQNTGSSSYGNVIAYEIDKQDKVNPITFPDPSKSNNSDGYMGKDSIYKEGSFLVRRFPLFKKTDPMCCPTGGWMLIDYVLNKNTFTIAKKTIE